MLARFFADYGYQFFLIAGSVAVMALMLSRRHIYSLSIFQAILYALSLLAIGILGTRVLYFFETGMESFSGRSFFGAIYLVLILMPWIGLLFKLKPLESLDACAPCGVGMVSFMRFGCFCAGCCGGVPIGDTGRVWPVQLMEGFGDMLILFLILYTERKGHLRGKGYPMFLLSYGVLRFILEFIRDTAKDWGGLAHGQWFAMVGVGIALLMMGGHTRWEKRNQEKFH